MLYYTFKRILMLIPVVIGISFLCFIVLSLSPTCPATMMLPLDAPPEAVESLRVQLGLDQPIIVQYINYMIGVVRLDFGRSWFQGFDVFTEFSHRLPYTLRLAVFATTVAVLLGVPAGIFSAVRHNRAPDYVITVFSLMFNAAPTFWMGMMFQIYFSLHLGWFPASGVGTWRHFALPVLALAVNAMAFNSRMTRTWLLDVIRSDYVRTARAKGNRESVVILKHALRNSLLPVVTQIGVNFANIVGGAIVVENVFAFPGVGSFLNIAVRANDIPIVVGTMIVVALFVGIINLAVDLLYAVIDPRFQYNK